MQIYIDESGFTGADYLNLDQPLYVLAGSWFDDELAVQIEQQLLAVHGHRELKFNKLVKSKKGRAAITKAVEVIAASDAKHQYAAYVVHKQSALVRKFVLDCIEPFFYRAGVEMLDEGRTITYANMMSCTLPAFMGASWFERFLEHYNRLIRTKEEGDNAALFAHCQRAQENPNAEEILRPYLLAPHLVLDELAHPAYRADMYQHIVFGMVVHMRHMFEIRQFEVFLDQTKATTSSDLAAHLRYLESLSQTHRMSDVCTVYDDIQVTRVHMVDSTQETGVRMSDFIAGLYSWTFKSDENRVSEVGQAVCSLLAENNLIHMVATPDVTSADIGWEGAANPWVHEL